MAAPRVVLLNGAPGVGKSTLARVWAERHPGTWVLDVDLLRTFVSGWRDDFAATGAVVRPVALAVLAEAARGGHDVVVPQLLASAGERDRFRAAAEEAGARWVEIHLRADDARSRLAARGDDQPWSAAVRALVDAAGPAGLDAWDERLAALHAAGGVEVLDTTGLDRERAADALDALVGGASV